ncbi:discoidin domain-containing protein [Nocardia sp. NPDC050799]|uniref:discoidin domain-containing protein n=1 Tax=Nocardia sp. NPDC050799 TaxID=3154842 RepID=UPI0033DAF48D
MPDADSGDVFLRNRGAILDALLSDPAFGLTGNAPEAASPAPEVAPVSSPAAPEIAFDESLLAPAPRARAASAPIDETPPPVGVRSTPVEPDSDPAVSRPRRSTAGPSASERINALLSGQLPDTRGSSFASDNAERVSDRLNSTAPPEAEAQRAADPEPARPERQSPQEMAREVVEQLRKPRVALAVAAVVALLIVVLLVVTGGKEEADTQPLAVTPAPTQPVPQPTAPSGGGTIEPESAESKCPAGGTDGMDAFSGEPDKAWSCPRAYKIDGQVLRIDLGKKYEIDSIAIVPGWDHVGTDGTDQWTKFRTVSRVSYQLNDDDKTTYTQETLDQRSLVVTQIEPPIEASEITLTVLKSSGDTSANTVAISSIVITGQ